MSWLNFNGVNSLTGTPDMDQAGTVINAIVTATNIYGGQASTGFNILTVDPLHSSNSAPEFLDFIPNQQAFVLTPFALSLPLRSFFDRDGDVLRFSAQYLASWLEFEVTNSSLEFSGEPSRDDTDPFAPHVLTVTLIAIDPLGSTAQTTFQISVQGTSNWNLALQIIGRLGLAAAVMGIFLGGIRSCINFSRKGKRYGKPIVIEPGARIPMESSDYGFFLGGKVRFSVKAEKRIRVCAAEVVKHSSYSDKRQLPDWLSEDRKNKELVVADWFKEPDLDKGRKSNDVLVVKRRGVVVKEHRLQYPSTKGLLEDSKEPERDLEKQEKHQINSGWCCFWRNQLSSSVERIELESYNTDQLPPEDHEGMKSDKSDLSASSS